MRPGAADGYVVPASSDHDEPVAVAVGKAGPRPAAWRRLCPASFVLAAVTVVIVSAAVADLLRQGRLQTVLSAVS